MLSFLDMQLLFDQYGMLVGSNFDLVRNQEGWSFAYYMLLNYDNAGHGYGNTAISSFSSNPDNLAIYGATRTADGALTVIAINKTNATITTPITIAGFTAASSVPTYTYSNANTGALVSSSTNTTTLASGYSFPAYSATELVLTPNSGGATPNSISGGISVKGGITLQ